jgi:hypothetical protein
MSRSIETLEAASSQEKPPRRSHMFAARTPAEGDAKIAELVANGTAHPDDLFFQLMPFPPDPSSHMHEHYSWDEAAGRWEPKDGRAGVDQMRSFCSA